MKVVFITIRPRRLETWHRVHLARYIGQAHFVMRVNVFGRVLGFYSQSVSAWLFISTQMFNYFLSLFVSKYFYPRHHYGIIPVRFLFFFRCQTNEENLR
jgi:hypothetical protein